MKTIIFLSFIGMMGACDIKNPDVGLKKSNPTIATPSSSDDQLSQAEQEIVEASREEEEARMIEEQMRGRYESALGYDLRLRREEIEPGFESRKVFGFQGLLDQLERSFQNPAPEMIQNAQSTFEITEARLQARTNFGAVAFNILHRSAKQMCGQLIADDASFQIEPNPENAAIYCRNWTENFWNREASEAELNLCIETAVVSTASAEEASERWAGTCAVLVSSPQFYSFEI